MRYRALKYILNTHTRARTNTRTRTRTRTEKPGVASFDRYLARFCFSPEINTAVKEQNTYIQRGGLSIPRRRTFQRDRSYLVREGTDSFFA